jgi:hypothetical protein
MVGYNHIGPAGLNVLAALYNDPYRVRALLIRAQKTPIIRTKREPVKKESAIPEEVRMRVFSR